MKEITKDLIIKDAKIKFSCAAHAFSMFIGVVAILIPLIQIGEINRDTIISMIFCLCVFGSLFGVYFGLIPLLRNINEFKNIKQGNIVVEKDVLIDKENINSRDDEDLKCLLMFEKYTAKTGKGVVRTRKNYKKVKLGEEFYLVYVGKETEPALIYSVSKYFYNGTLH